VRYRAFGSTGLTVSEIGVGCSRIGGVFSAGSSRSGELRLLSEAIDRGITFFDTADLYSQGQSEMLLGKAIRRRRGDVIVATKAGYVVPAGSRALSRIKPLVRPVVRVLKVKKPGSAPGPSAAMPQDFSPDHLRVALEASLRRLGTDYVDVFQLHSPPEAVVRAGDFVPALERLRDEGKIRHFGVAVDEVAHLDGVTRHPAIGTIQLPYSAIDRAAAEHAFPAASTLGAGVISRSCYAAGLLVGDLPEAELRERTPDWPAIMRFREVAARLGRPRRELALQFNLSEPAIAVTIIGMRTTDHLDETLRSWSAPPLSAGERAQLKGVA
jgi:aryl-alcohol dehydrogenase-like predicted oxidoreductase